MDIGFFNIGGENNKSGLGIDFTFVRNISHMSRIWNDVSKSDNFQEGGIRSSSRVTDLSKIVVEFKAVVVGSAVMVFLFRETHVDVFGPFTGVHVGIDLSHVDKDGVASAGFADAGSSPKVEEDWLNTGSRKVGKMRERVGDSFQRSKTFSDKTKNVHRRSHSRKSFLKFESRLIRVEKTSHMSGVEIFRRRSGSQEFVSVVYPGFDHSFVRRAERSFKTKFVSKPVDERGENRDNPSSDLSESFGGFGDKIAAAEESVKILESESDVVETRDKSDKSSSSSKESSRDVDGALSSKRVSFIGISVPERFKKRSKIDLGKNSRGNVLKWRDQKDRFGKKRRVREESNKD